MQNHARFKNISQWVGLVSLTLFLFLHYGLSALLFIGDRQSVQQVIHWQSGIILMVLEWLVILVPLFFHLGVSLMRTVRSRLNVFKYGFANHWLSLLQRLALMVVVAFVGLHVYFDLSIFKDQFEGLQFIQAIILFNSSPVLMMVYWLGLLVGVFYFVRLIWQAAIDGGWAHDRASQKFVARCCILFFVVMTVMTAVVLVGQFLGGVA